MRRPRCSASASRSTARATCCGLAKDPLQVVVARQAYVANDRAEAEAALKQQGDDYARTVDVSRAPGAKAGSHVLSYARRPQGTEANALYGTPDEEFRGA